MLFLLFQLGNDRYAIDAGQVAEILPSLHFKRIPHSPLGVAGVFNYHGTPVPLIDLTYLALGRPSQAKMSTRIILINHSDESGSKHLLGVIAEHVMENMQRAESDFGDSGVATAEAPYLGSVTTDRNGIIQRIEVRNLLPASLWAQLFCELVEPV